MVTRIHVRSIAMSSLLAAALATLGGCPMFPTPPEPTPADEPGPFTVGVYETAFQNANGNYLATVKYPLEGTGAPYPVVAVAPGTCAIRDWYLWIGDHLATHGYVVLTFTAPDPCFGGPFQISDGFRDAFTHLEAEGASAGSPLFGLVDSTERAVMGHSLGAIAVELYAAFAPNDLETAVALAPGPLDGPTMAMITAPMQIHGGSNDGIVPAARARAAYDLVTNAPRELLVIEGANHVSFNDEGSIADIGGPLVGDGTRTVAGKDHAQRLSRRYFTAWLDYFLKGQGEAREYLDGAQAQQDEAEGWFTDFEVDID
ncbi:MAG: hypothetical protein KC466_21445 [Myxococcales bacterium]|nr:hypothetical protein [Myxococcales bacterium]